MDKKAVPSAGGCRNVSQKVQRLEANQIGIAGKHTAYRILIQ
jgi:hypothetical protein